MVVLEARHIVRDAHSKIRLRTGVLISYVESLYCVTWAPEDFQLVS